MAGGLSTLATYGQRTVTFLLFGATCYYGTSFIHSSYILRKKRKERELQHLVRPQLETFWQSVIYEYEEPPFLSFLLVNSSLMLTLLIKGSKYNLLNGNDPGLYPGGTYF